MSLRYKLISCCPGASKRTFLVLVLLTMVTGAGWWWAVHWSAPAPPEPPVPENVLDHLLEDAISEAVAKVKAEPNSAAAWGHLGKFYLANRFLTQAGACFEQAAKLDPGDFQWPYHLGILTTVSDMDAALAHFSMAHRLKPDQEFVAYKVAYMRFLKGETEVAETMLRELVRQNPSHIFAVYQLGQIYLGKNELDKAQPLLQSATQHLATSRGAWRHLALLYHQKKETAAEQEALRRFGQTSDTFDDVDPILAGSASLITGRRRFSLRMDAFMRVNRVAEASEVCLQAIAAYPHDEGNYVTLAEMLLSSARLSNLDMRKRYLEQAEHALAAYARMKPHDSRVLMYQGLVFLEKMDDTPDAGKAAIHLFRECAKRGNADPSLFLFLATALKKLGEVEEATKVLRSVLAKHPTFEPALSLLAGIHLFEHDAVTAYCLFEKAALHDMGDDSVIRILALTFCFRK
jgi:tetratricopeptide (TPR) repeat protein